MRSARQRHDVIRVFLLAVLLAASCRRECSDSLVQQFPKAQFAPETWLIDFGVPDFRTHLVSGWGGDERRGDERVSFVWGLPPASVIRLNRYGSADVRLRFRCAPKSGEQRVTIVVNGAVVATAQLAPGFAIHEAAVPASRLRLGENRIEFRSERPDPVAWDWLEILESRAKPNMRTPRKENETVVIPYRSSVRYELELPPKSALATDAIDVEGTIGSVGPGSVVFTLRSDGGGTLASFTAVPDGKPAQFALLFESRTRAQLEIMALEPRGGAPLATAVKLLRPRIRNHCR